MKKLIVVRPEPGATATLQAAQAMGMEARAMPLFVVRPLPWEPPSAERFDAVLMTSANAARHGGSALERFVDLPMYAIGEATAAAARDAGFIIRAVGIKDVAHLLAGVPPSERLLHLAGAHRTPFESSHEVETIAVYVSEATPTPAAFGEVEGNVVAMHSRRAAKRFAELVDAAGIDRGSVAILGLSEAVLDGAGSGWASASAPAVPSDEALLALAMKLCNKPDPE